MIILSTEPVSSLEMLQVKQILRQSRCPNESLRNTFARFTGLIDGKIFFDDAAQVWSDIAAQFADKKFADAIIDIDACPHIIITII